MLIFNTLAFVIAGLRAMANAAMTVTEKLDNAADASKVLAYNNIVQRHIKSEQRGYEAIRAAQRNITRAQERLSAAVDAHERLTDDNAAREAEQKQRLEAL